MKKSIKKLSAIVMAIVVLAGIMPLAGLEGVLKFNLVSVEAAEADPFDTSKLTVLGSGKYSGVAWILYNNGLLWVVDDTSGETSYPSSGLRLTSIIGTNDFKALATDVVYVYWNVTAQPNVSYIFYNSPETIKIIKLGTVFVNSSANATDMKWMFAKCSAESIEGLDKLDTSNVTDMSSMFSGCKKLKLLDVSKFDTSKVTTMSSMFSNCEELTSLNIDNFNTSNVINMYYMFSGCNKLKSLDLSKFDTSKVTDMSGIFSNCGSLTTLNIDNFNTSNVVRMCKMFYNCSSLSSLDLSGFDTSKVTDMSGMFYDCEGVISLDVSNFNTSKVKNMSEMFSGCKTITSLDLKNFDTSNVEDLSHFVKDCSSLKVIDISSFRTPKLKEFINVFLNCSSLKEIDLSNFDFSGIEEMFINFYDNQALHLIKLPANYIMDGKYLDYVWYKLNSDKTIDKTQQYEALSFTTTEPLILIRELTHSCNSVSNGRGTCSMCGVTVVYGDNNDDGKVSVSDAVILKKYLAGDTTTKINLGASNVNADTAVNLDDAVKLMKHLAGMDVELGVAE